MLLTLTLPDDLYEKYKAFDTSDPRRAVVRQLATMQDYTPYKRNLVLKAEHIRELDALLNGSVDSPEQLIAGIKRVCTVQVGGAEVTLTKNQISRVAEHALRMRQEPEAVLQDLANRTIRANYGA